MATVAYNLDLAAKSAPNADCSHCGLPVPSARRDPDQATQFCCDGCSAVYSVLNSSGLEAYYQKQNAAERRAAPAPSRLGFEELDEPGFAEQHCRSLGRGLSSVDLYLEGI